MANYIGFCRSNHFQVKDPAAFESFCKKWNVEMTRRGENPELFGFLGGEETGLPSMYFDEGEGQYVDGDFIKELSTHLANGWVAIVREIGFEKMRYLVGYTVAVNSQGKCLEVSLDRVYDDAKRLGRHRTRCEY